MSSARAQVDGIRAALQSTDTCTAATAIQLKQLLGTQNGVSEETSRSRATRKAIERSTTRSMREKPGARTKTGKGQEDEFTLKEKIVLASDVVNAALKLLGEAAKGAKKTEDSRPLQERSPNKITKSPTVTEETKGPPGSQSSTGYLAVAECARTAFAALRQLPKSAGALPEWQLESGMSALIGKLITLGMLEAALQELYILKGLLEVHMGPKKAVGNKEPVNGSSPRLETLLNWSGLVADGVVLSLVVTTQMHLLRILAKSKRSTTVEACMPHLLIDCSTSPISLLLRSAKASDAAKTKAARELDSLSRLLLSLAPSVSRNDEHAAKDARINVTPATALQLQQLSLRARLEWWQLAGHQAEFEKDIWTPLSRCMATYARRSDEDAEVKYRVSSEVFQAIRDRTTNFELDKADASKALASCHQILTSLAKDADKKQEAVSHAAKVNEFADPRADSVARRCAQSAQLLALKLRAGDDITDLRSLLDEVVAFMSQPLRGSCGELNELLLNLCAARKAVTTRLSSGIKSKADSDEADYGQQLKQIVLQMIRFCIRWLGKRPAPGDSREVVSRYEDRRSTLLRCYAANLDAALMLLKLNIDHDSVDWDNLDSQLQDCLALLDAIDDQQQINSSASYYAKVSHLYYLVFDQQQRKAQKRAESASLKPLARSINCVRHRGTKEREKAQLIVKLECMAKLCKERGRLAETLGALQSIRSCMLDDGVLHRITQATGTELSANAWALDAKTEALSKTLCSIAKLEPVWIDWTVDLNGLERIVALEHHLTAILLPRSKIGIPISETPVQALLELCAVDQHPVRRLRMLAELLLAATGDQEQVIAVTEVENGMLTRNATDLALDETLAYKWPHVKTFYRSVATLSEVKPDLVTLGDCISNWRRLRPTESWAAVLEDAEALTSHLVALSNYLDLNGQYKLQLSVLQLASEVQQSVAMFNEQSLRLSANMARLYVDQGRCERALAVMHAHKPKQGSETGAQYHSFEMLLTQAGTCLIIGDEAEALSHLTAAQQHLQSLDKITSAAKQRMLTMTFLLTRGLLAHRQGQVEVALSSLSSSAKALKHEWTHMLRRASGTASNATALVITREEISEDAASMSAASACEPQPSGPVFWALAPLLVQSLLGLSTIYAFLGLAQEMIYYAEQSQKIADSMASAVHSFRCSAVLALMHARCGEHAKSLAAIKQARSLMSDLESSCAIIESLTQLRHAARVLGDEDAATAFSSLALKQLADLGDSEPAAPPDAVSTITTKLAAVKIDSTTGPVRKSRTIAKKTAATAPRSLPKPTPKFVAKSSCDDVQVVKPQDNRLMQVVSACNEQQVASLLIKEDWVAAQAVLDKMSKRASSAQQVARSTVLLGIASQSIATDPVLSILQDSTLSFPSVCSALENASHRLSLGSSPSPSKRPCSRGCDGTDATPAAYVETLRKVRDYLIHGYGSAARAAGGHELQYLVSMLQKVAMLTSAAQATFAQRPSTPAHCAGLAVSTEIARNLVWQRERHAIALDKLPCKHVTLADLAQIDLQNDRSDVFDINNDIKVIQRDFVNVIPKSWEVISLSLSNEKDELLVTKFVPDQTPFVLRLPLGRSKAENDDEERFDFSQGHSHMLEIIRLANDSCHDKRDFSVKGAKTAWWSEREALDERLRELLAQIEREWLGGFRGVLSQQTRHVELLASFQASLNAVFDKYLPSRQQIRGNNRKIKPVSKPTLDPRVLELFVGLGDASEPDADFEEELYELLNFVVDIFQFNGEHNAYDEVDFDAMVVETFDALHSYHTTMGNDIPMKIAEARHTVLVLDKSLHSFPWESLPCMQGLAVSRVSSLACLQRLIKERLLVKSIEDDQVSPDKSTSSSASPRSKSASSKGRLYQDCQVSRGSGSYILNPGSDLKNTQTTFQEPLANRVSSPSSPWASIINRPPAESEFESALLDKDILLYFGHGSGAQYIRSRSIRTLTPQCRATVFLMGCSSASLVDTHEYEPYGPVWNYMHAGCPAVVGTLWDVTDRDIDRFAGRVFEEWGLVERGTFGDDKDIVKMKKGGVGTRAIAAAGKGKKAAKQQEKQGGYGQASLVQAVATARQEACVFKYLNAAAAVVYGIPVYVGR